VIAKRLFLLGVIIPSIVIIFLVAVYYIDVDLGDKRVSIIIKPGDSFTRVSKQLLSEEVVASKLVLKLASQWRGLDRKLVPGRYDFVGSNSCKSVLDKLERADFVNIKVTIFEGATLWNTASILALKMGIDSSSLVALNFDSAFLDSIGVPSLEGYLFPETYFFPWGEKLRPIVREMVTMYFKQVSTLSTQSSPLKPNKEDIVLASIVQAEAYITKEMPTIASVYLNRITKGWKLDADPTVIYGLGGMGRLVHPLTRSELRKDTPYNTYIRRGLPPTAINSPGLAAIKAVLNPEKSDYLFFVADGSGNHRFSKTNAEHNRNKREIKKERGYK